MAALSELAYLLQELSNWDDNKPIQVKDLRKMIEKAFKKYQDDEERVIEAYDIPHT